MKNSVYFIVTALLLLLQFTVISATGAQETSLSEITKALGFGNSTTTQTQKNASGISSYTNDEAVLALKEALKKGASYSSEFLSKEDAYYKNPLYFIDIPEDAKDLVNVVSKVPGGKKMVEDVVLRLNRTAESAAKEIIPIFAEAITGMSVADGISIVIGKDNAATEYLRSKTYSQLSALYKPKIAAALDQKIVGKVSANDAWEKLVSTYNKASSTTNKIGSIFGNDELVKVIDTDLAQYATDKALNAVFLKMADEEKEIRANPMQYASDIISKVFGAVKASR